MTEFFFFFFCQMLKMQWDWMTRKRLRITVIQFSIDKNQISALKQCGHTRAPKSSFHDQFAFLFVLTAVKCYLVKSIGYDHFANVQEKMYVLPIKQSKCSPHHFAMTNFILDFVLFFFFLLLVVLLLWCCFLFSISHNLLLHTVVFIQRHPIYTVAYLSLPSHSI